jgi:hypothetical protein
MCGSVKSNKCKSVNGNLKSIKGRENEVCNNLANPTEDRKKMET